MNIQKAKFLREEPFTIASESKDVYNYHRRNNKTLQRDKRIKKKDKSLLFMNWNVQY